MPYNEVSDQKVKNAKNSTENYQQVNDQPDLEEPEEDAESIKRPVVFRDLWERRVSAFSFRLGIT